MLIITVFFSMAAKSCLKFASSYFLSQPILSCFFFFLLLQWFLAGLFVYSFRSLDVSTPCWPGLSAGNRMIYYYTRCNNNNHTWLNYNYIWSSLVHCGGLHFEDHWIGQVFTRWPRRKQRWWWWRRHNTAHSVGLGEKDGGRAERTPIGDVCLLCGLSRPPGWRFDVTANLTAADENDVPSRILGMLSQPWSSVQAIFPTLSLTALLPHPLNTSSEHCWRV